VTRRGVKSPLDVSYVKRRISRKLANPIASLAIIRVEVGHGKLEAGVKRTKELVILMADDDSDDCMFVRDALRGKPVNLQFVENGLELLDYLLCRGSYKGGYPRPDLILLDLNMPKMGGKEALAIIKADPHLRSVPVVILTTSHEECEVHRCYELGANTYIVKPLTFQRLVETLHQVHLYWTGIAERPAHPIPPSCVEG
jgi:two-component system response regulator